jgi:ParB family transcriptional regulator, chromosome partitioning protein
MALDLSALNSKPTAQAQLAPAPTGQPIILLLTDVEEDPNQPRTEFPEDEIAEMSESIKIRGVKQPISVKTHPTNPGKWMINDGAVRYRASIRAKKIDITAFVDEDFDGFDQVVANDKRYALRPMELARFVQGKLDEGVKKGEVARRLGKPANMITELLSLIGAPSCVEDSYTSGRCTSPKTLYELRSLYEKFPEQVQAWCESAAEVTRRGVAALGDELKGKKKTVLVTETEDEAGNGASHEQVGQGSEAGKFRHDEILGGGQKHGQDGTGSGEGDKLAGSSEQSVGKPSGVKAEPNAGKESGKPEGGAGDNIDRGELSSWPRGKAVSDPDIMKKPLLIVEFEGRSAAVLLNRRPTTQGLIRIRYEDGSGDAEVDAGLCKINLLTEEEK